MELPLLVNDAVTFLSIIKAVNNAYYSHSIHSKADGGNPGCSLRSCPKTMVRFSYFCFLTYSPAIYCQLAARQGFVNRLATLLQPTLFLHDVAVNICADYLVPLKVAIVVHGPRLQT